MPERSVGEPERIGLGLHRFAVATAVSTVLLIVAGGLVTSTESGLSVPDWPLSYGRLMPPMVGGVFYEHGHRMVATAVGLMTIVLTVWIARREPRRWVRRLGWGALATVVAQGVLGGLTVLFLLPTPVSVAHACLAQTFFCLTVALAVVTSPRWREGSPVSVRSRRVTRIAAATAVVVFAQLLVGAVMRHNKAGLAIPDFPLSLGRLVPPLDTFPVVIAFTHRLVALLVFGLVCATVAGAFFSQRPGLKKASVLLAALVLAQIGLGAWTVLSRRAVPIATAHVATGALLLGGSLAISLGARAAAVASRPAAESFQTGAFQGESQSDLFMQIAPASGPRRSLRDRQPEPFKTGALDA